MMIEFLREMGPTIVGCLALIGVLLFPIYWVEDWQCRLYGKQTGRNVEYVLFAGCYVEIDGQWLPREEVRTIND